LAEDCKPTVVFKQPQKKDTTRKKEPTIDNGNTEQVTRFPTYGKYVGYINKCGKFDGTGTMYYFVRYQVSPFDSTMTQPNDYVTGNWVNGYLDNGKLKDANGNIKAQLIIGVPETYRDCNK
jgi:hypothetical protein